MNSLGKLLSTVPIHALQLWDSLSFSGTLLHVARRSRELNHHQTKVSFLMLSDSCVHAFCTDMEVRTLTGRAPKTVGTVRVKLETWTGNQRETPP